ncbi:lytic transglycosylase domain-containing protein [Tepidiforma bonchosmolovskayae]|uniref:Transglycosylase SLT domain-containing protein n=1 Tax=Tepidiforma bonchosmolovskayae TaxID=2601677 RepID=A0ABX6BZK9_9CHLR|nr:hypothetical protein [Tepidiforma bonchosmolovskayae]QFG02175.1 hypothetical protein Tbon_02300 [Tepidiforma bonchosmolovskayae]
MLVGCGAPAELPVPPGIVTATPAPAWLAEAQASAPTDIDPQPEATPWPAQLTEAQMREVLRLAGWPAELVDEALAVSWCESRWSPGAVGDGGSSLGLFQLWGGWFAAVGLPLERWDDPVVNATAALRVLELRGRWGGPGGWSCWPP